LIFTYTASVILLSLAMYGAWCVIQDIWNWVLRPRLLRIPSVTFLILVKNLQSDIEDMLRYLEREMESMDLDCDAVVVDCNSEDLTPAILDRLAKEFPEIRIYLPVDNSRPVAEALPLCRGAVVHVLDLVNRLSVEDFMATVCALLRHAGHEVIIRQRKCD